MSSQPQRLLHQIDDVLRLLVWHFEASPLQGLSPSAQEAIASSPRLKRGDCGVGDNELVHALRVKCRIAQCHQPTIAMSKNACRSQLEVVRETAEIAHH